MTTFKHPFQSRSKRIRSWFTPGKPRTFQHTTCLVMETLEGRLAPAGSRYGGLIPVHRDRPSLG